MLDAAQNKTFKSSQLWESTMLGRWLGHGRQARSQKNYLADVNLRTGEFEGEPGKIFAVGNIFFQVRPQNFQYVNLRAQKKFFEHVNLRTGKFEDEPGNFFADQGFLFPGSSSNFPVRKFTSASFFLKLGLPGGGLNRLPGIAAIFVLSCLQSMPDLSRARRSGGKQWWKAASEPRVRQLRFLCEALR